MRENDKKLNLNIPGDVREELDKEKKEYKKHIWKTWEIETCREYYGYVPTKELAKKINKTPQQIWDKMKNLGISAIERREEKEK